MTWLPVDDDGSVAPASLREALQDHDDVALVSIMWANNEVGTIMPIAELAAIAAEFDVPMHSDAIQAVGQIARRLRRERAVGDERCGPQVRRPDRRRRAAAAPRHRLRAAVARRRTGARRPFRHTGCRGRGRDGRRGKGGGRGPRRQRAAYSALRDRLIDGVLSTMDDVDLNGATGAARLPGNTHFTFRGCEGDALLMLLDAKGDRVLDRIGLHRGRRAAVARPDRDGRRPGQRTGLAAIVVGPHQHRAPTSTLRSQCCPRRSTGPGRPRLASAGAAEPCGSSSR